MYKICFWIKWFFR